jgi:hypothetical protein
MVACEWEFFALTHNVPELWRAQSFPPEPKEIAGEKMPAIPRRRGIAASEPGP